VVAYLPGPPGAPQALPPLYFQPYYQPYYSAPSIYSPSPSPFPASPTGQAFFPPGPAEPLPEYCTVCGPPAPVSPLYYHQLQPLSPATPTVFTFPAPPSASYSYPPSPAVAYSVPPPSPPRARRLAGPVARPTLPRPRLPSISVFNSPFKQFTLFRGTPSQASFPMRQEGRGARGRGGGPPRGGRLVPAALHSYNPQAGPGAGEAGRSGAGHRLRRPAGGLRPDHRPAPRVGEVHHQGGSNL
jgi:hypothetical protein